MPASELANTPVPDELAQVRDDIKRLEEREEELRGLLIANKDLREGNAWLAEIKVVQRQTTDLKELRANYPKIVEQFTHAVDTTRVVLSGISEDGELISGRRMRSTS